MKLDYRLHQFRSILVEGPLLKGKNLYDTRRSPKGHKTWLKFVLFSIVLKWASFTEEGFLTPATFFNHTPAKIFIKIELKIKAKVFLFVDILLPRYLIGSFGFDTLQQFEGSHYKHSRQRNLKDQTTLSPVLQLSYKCLQESRPKSNC